MSTLREEVSKLLGYVIHPNQWQSKLKDLESKGIYGDKAKSDILITLLEHVEALENKIEEIGHHDPGVDTKVQQ